MTDQLIENLNSTVFLWAHKWWFSISTIEFYTLVLLGILTVYKAKEQVRQEQNRRAAAGKPVLKNEQRTNREIRIFIHIWGIFAFLPALLCPDILFFIYPVIAPLAYYQRVSVFALPGEALPDVAWKELGIMVAIAITLVAASYTIARLHAG